MFLGENCPNLKLSSTFVIHKMLIEHQEEDIKWIFEELAEKYCLYDTGERIDELFI